MKQNLLKKYNLSLGTISYSVDTNNADGVVIDQDVAPNVQVREKTIINITINKVDTSLDNQNETDTQNSKTTQ